jgi:hypothetical protein
MIDERCYAQTQHGHRCSREARVEHEASGVEMAPGDPTHIPLCHQHARLVRQAHRQGGHQHAADLLQRWLRAARPVFP